MRKPAVPGKVARCREIIKEEIADRLSIDISLKREGDKIMLNEQEP